MHCSPSRQLFGSAGWHCLLKTLLRTYTRAAHDNGYQVIRIFFFEGVRVQRFPAIVLSVTADTGFLQSNYGEKELTQFRNPPLVFRIPSFEASPPSLLVGVALSRQAECSVGARFQPTTFLGMRSSAARAAAAFACRF